MRLASMGLSRSFSSLAGRRVLITGACGQIGVELAPLLRSRLGTENVVCTDVKKPPASLRENGPFLYGDVTDYRTLEKIVIDRGIDVIIHNASLLSGAGEKNPKLAMQVNISGINNVLELARVHSLSVFSPSSIAAFGPTTPQIARHLNRVASGQDSSVIDPDEGITDITIQRPTTIYGISKVYVEHLGEYYHRRFGVDFRSLRYPGIISATEPGFGTTDYAVYMYLLALAESPRYTCFLRKDTLLPMMYMPDCLRATVELLDAPNESLFLRTYNVTAMSFTPEELLASIRKYVPNFELDYEPDFRQPIADTWPRVFDDSAARRDWAWKHHYDLDAMTVDMLEKMKSVKLRTSQ